MSVLEIAKGKLKKGSRKLDVKEVNALVQSIKELNKLEKSKFATFLDEVETSAVQQRKLVELDPEFAVKYITDMWPSVQLYVLQNKPKLKADLFKNTQYFASTHVAVVKAMLADSKVTSRIMGYMITGVDSMKAKLDIIKKFPDCVKFSDDKVELNDEARDLVLTHDKNLAKYLKRSKKSKVETIEVNPAKVIKEAKAPKVQPKQEVEEEDDEPISTPAKESIAKNEAAVKELHKHLTEYGITIPVKEIEVSLERGTTAKAIKAIKDALEDDDLIDAAKKEKVDPLFLVLALTNFTSNKFNKEQKKKFVMALEFAEEVEDGEEDKVEEEVQIQPSRKEKAKAAEEAKTKASTKPKVAKEKKVKVEDDEDDDEISVTINRRNHIIDIGDDDDGGSDFEDREWLNRMEATTEVPKETVVPLTAEDERKFVNFVKLAVRRLLEDPGFLRKYQKSVSKAQLEQELEDFDKLNTLVNSKQVKEFEGLTSTQRSDILDLAIPANVITFTTTASSAIDTFNELGATVQKLIEKIDFEAQPDVTNLKELIAKCVQAVGGTLKGCKVSAVAKGRNGQYPSSLTLQVVFGNDQSVLFVFDLINKTWKFA